MTPLRVGLIGSGGISRTYMAAFQHVPEGEVVAVWSRQRENADRFATQFEIGFATDRVEELLPQVDVVCVNSPNACHAQHAHAADGSKGNAGAGLWIDLIDDVAKGRNQGVGAGHGCCLRASRLASFHKARAVASINEQAAASSALSMLSIPCW